MKTSIIVKNLKCNDCVQTITTNLLELDFISDLHIDVDHSQVSFNYTSDMDALKVKEELKHLGYPSIDAGHSLVL